MAAHKGKDHDRPRSSSRPFGACLETELRVRALESIPTEKGYVDPRALDDLVDNYENKIGPRNGARVIARASYDADFRARLMDDAPLAIAVLGYSGRQGEWYRCSGEYASFAQRGRLARYAPQVFLAGCWGCRQPGTKLPLIALGWWGSRGVLAEFGVSLPPDIAIEVWDSTAEIRYLVVPTRPEGTENWSEEELRLLSARNSMIGTGLAKQRTEVA